MMEWILGALMSGKQKKFPEMLHLSLEEIKRVQKQQIVME